MENSIEVKAEDKVLQGRYSNLVQVSHTKEEFVLDFIEAFPPTNQLVSRIIVSPGHFKRFAKAVSENLAAYEKANGNIESTSDKPNKIGFKTN